jgi:SulP family sulfate permease
VLNSEEKQLLDQAQGRVLLFYLSGPMIFGVSKAIARQHNAVGDCDVIVMDLSDVPHLGVTASLEIENAIRDAVEKGRQVYIVGAAGKVKRRLEKLGVFQVIPSHHLFTSRTDALKQAAIVANAATSSQSVSDIDFSSAVQA